MAKSSTYLVGFILALGFTFHCIAQTTNAPEASVLVQGRPIAAWVAEVGLGGLPGTNIANDVLISAGPPIIPALSHFLLGKESAKDLIMRLPCVPIETKDLHASTSDTLLFKAKSASVLGAIAYRNPNAPEVLKAIPSLTTALGSGSREVRFRAAQALGAIGKGATNAIPRLVSSTRDDDSGVRMCAVEALGRIGASSPEAVAALKAALSDTSSDVRITARQVMDIQKGHK